MDKIRLVSRVVTLTSARVVGMWGLSSPQPRQVLSRLLLSSLPRVDILLQVRSDMLGEWGLCIWQIFSFLTIRECIEDKRFTYPFAVGECNARVLLLHICHSWSGHELETRIVGEWSCVVVWNFMAPFYLLPITEKSASTLNGVDVWFLIVTIVSSRS